MQSKKYLIRQKFIIVATLATIKPLQVFYDIVNIIKSKEKRKNKFEGKTRPYELCV